MRLPKGALPNIPLMLLPAAVTATGFALLGSWSTKFVLLPSVTLSIIGRVSSTALLLYLFSLGQASHARYGRA